MNFYEPFTNLYQRTGWLTTKVRVFLPANETLKLTKYVINTTTKVTTIEYKAAKSSVESTAHSEERSIDIPWDNASHEVSTEIFDASSNSGGVVIDHSDDAQP
jgi:hypothetical protein